VGSNNLCLSWFSASMTPDISRKELVNDNESESKMGPREVRETGLRM